MARSRRPSTCRWCYATGHNSNGCPKKKEYIQANPSSWVAVTAKEKSKKTCTYCRTSGHTRTTCEELKEYRRVTRIRILENREKICNGLIELGIGPGTLVKTDTYDSRIYSWSKVLCLVEGIEWSDLCDSNGVRYVLKVRDFRTQKEATVPLPAYVSFDNHYSNDTVVVSPISTALAEKYNRKMMETTAETALSKIHIPKNKY
jgi:hypothetical protein